MTFRFYLVTMFIVIFSFLLNSCMDEKSNETPLSDSLKEVSSNINSNSNVEQTSSNVQNKSNKKDSALTKKEQEYLASLKLKEKKQEIYDQVAKVKNLTKDELIEFLPPNLDGFQSLPPTTARTVENDTSITILTRKQFIDNKRRTVLFDIFDYGRGNKVLNSHIYEKVPEDLDAPAFPFAIPNAKGFYYWLEPKLYGHLEVLVNNRFVIMVRTNGFERDDKILENYLKKINITKLIKSGNK